MNENNKNIQGISENGYERIDKFDGKRTEELAKSYHKILKNIVVITLLRGRKIFYRIGFCSKFFKILSF